MFRLLGILALTAIFLLAGADKIQSPAKTVSMIKSGNFPKLLKLADLPALGTPELTLLAQIVGAVQVAASAFIIVGFARRFFAHVLALLVIGITVCQHVNVFNPLATSEAELINVLKNLAIVGALWILAAPAPRASRAAAPAAQVASQNSKKKQ